MHSFRETAPIEKIYLNGHRVQGIDAYKPAAPTNGPHRLGPAIGSCAFLLARHGDLRIEWEEKDHAEIVKLIADKMAEGWHFFETDRTGKIVPIHRRSPTGTHVLVHDGAIKAMMEAGFARFPTTRFEGRITRVRLVESAEEAFRCHTVGTPAWAGCKGAVEPDILLGDQRIMECLNTKEMQQLTGEGEFTLKRTQLWILRGKLPVVNRRGPHSRLQVARQRLVDWFTDINGDRDP